MFVRLVCIWLRRFEPGVRQHSFVEIGHEIISMAILSLPLIQTEQLSVTGERMFTWYWLTAQEARNSVVRLTDSSPIVP